MLEILPVLRLLSADCFISLAELAARLGMPLPRVSRLLTQAPHYGIFLEHHKVLGYRLAYPLEWLDGQAVIAGLPSDSVIQLRVVEETESTNQVLLAHPQHGSVLAAEWQYGGRGRMKRPWLGALGGSLLFSLAWTFPSRITNLTALPLVVGAALAETLSVAGVNEIGIKWPNDLLLPLGKVGGVLVETSTHSPGPLQVVIGIGLNLYFLIQWQSKLDQPVAALYDAGLQPGRNALLVRLLIVLESTLTRFASDGFSPFSALWEAYHLWQGEEVEFHTRDGQAKMGRVLGVTEAGLLRLAVPEGEVHIHSSEALLLRQRTSCTSSLI